MVKTNNKKTGLIMSGGGARAAYQVGVLKAIAELVHKDTPNPFHIICGTSAGAINAASLATHAYSFRKSVQRILSVWRGFHAHHVFKVDVLSILYIALQWFLSIVFAGRGRKEKYLYLLDRTPLRNLLEKYIHTRDIQYSIEQGYVDALCITASGFSSHQSVSFFHGSNKKQAWQRHQRIGVRTSINVDHLMASSAIPFVFEPQKIHREYFGDGSMRQNAPISPALHLGAERVLVIGNRMDWSKTVGRTRDEGAPTIGAMAGHALDSIFLDSLIADIERLQRINKTISLIPEKQRKKYDIPLRHVDVLVISPSEDMGKLASDYVEELPWTIRFLLGGIGGTKKKESNLISYLLFERGYCRRLIDLGYQDAMQKRDKIIEFLELA